jgi:hypothetical protein
MHIYDFFRPTEKRRLPRRRRRQTAKPKRPRKDVRRRRPIKYGRLVSESCLLAFPPSPKRRRPRGDPCVSSDSGSPLLIPVKRTVPLLLRPPAMEKRKVVTKIVTQTQEC